MTSACFCALRALFNYKIDTHPSQGRGGHTKVVTGLVMKPEA